MNSSAWLPAAKSLHYREDHGVAERAALRVRRAFDTGRLPKAVEQARQFAEFNRFHEVRIKTRDPRALMIRRLSVTRHRDEPNPATRSKVARELIAVHHWQADVEHADSRGTFVGNAQRRRSIHCNTRAVTECGQRLVQKPRRVLVVVHEKDMLAFPSWEVGMEPW